MKGPELKKENNKNNMAVDINEAHGKKKHNPPKDELAAMRKGNREAELDVFGGGFRQRTKKHKLKGEKISKKVDLDRVGNDDMNETRVISYDDLSKIINEEISKHLKSILKEEDENFTEEQLADGTGYFIDNLFFNVKTRRTSGDMGYDFGDKWDCGYSSKVEALQNFHHVYDDDIKADMLERFKEDGDIIIYMIGKYREYELVKKCGSFIPKYFERYADIIEDVLNMEIRLIN